MELLNVKRIRWSQTLFSIVMFIVVLLLCWNETKFDITKIQLSYFGVFKTGWVSTVWNLSLEIISMSIFYNVYHYLKHNNRISGTKLFQHIFFIVSLFLFLTGLIDMRHTIHTVFAWLYFFLYPLTIFSFAFYNRKNLPYDEWKKNVIFSLMMLVTPLLVIHFFKGMALAEICHSTVVLGWNFWILFF